MAESVSVPLAQYDKSAYVEQGSYPVDGFPDVRDDLRVARSFVSGTGDYEVSVVVLLFDTSTLPDDFRPNAASLEVHIVDAAAADGLCLNAEWYPHRPIVADDWTDASATSALNGYSLATLADHVGQSYTIPLDNASGFSRCLTGLRLTIQQTSIATDGSGYGLPTGENLLQIMDFESGSPATLIWSKTATAAAPPSDDTQTEDRSDGYNAHVEIADYAGALLAGGAGPIIEYRAKLRRRGSARVAV